MFEIFELNFPLIKKKPFPNWKKLHHCCAQYLANVNLEKKRSRSRKVNSYSFGLNNKPRKSLNRLAWGRRGREETEEKKERFC